MQSCQLSRVGFLATAAVILALGCFGAGGARAGEYVGKLGCVEKAFASKPAKAEAWNRTRSSFVAKLGEPRHRLYDSVVVQGTVVDVVGKFTYGPLDKDLEAEAVELFGQVPGTCAWTSLGRSKTEQHGAARPTDASRLDDGEAAWHVDTSTWPVGAYPLRAVVLGDLTEVGAWIYVVPKGTQLIVSDIDGTLCEEAHDAAGVAATVLAGVEALRRFEGAQETIQAWVTRGYLPVYLTGRPGALKPATLRWLKKQGFPQGPVVVARTSGDVVPSASGVQRYKARTVQAWLDAGLQVYAAYGNATTDIGAYADAKLPKTRTFIMGPHRGKSGTAAWPGYTKQHIEWVATQPQK